MKVAIPKEITHGEKRVALVPSLVQPLLNLGCTLLFQNGAGMGAFYDDSQYNNVEFYDDAQSLYKEADIILKVEAPTSSEIAHFKKNAIVIGFMSPYQESENILALRNNHITSFAMEFIPRISRAQSMDALSSQATVIGYKAALIAANSLQRFFPMLTTAAGTIRPSQVLVIGAGVAGLQAIATAHRLGAVVKAYDIRSAAREQVESLGAKMVTIDIKAEAAGGYARELTADEKQKQFDALFKAISQSEAVISTALIPGRPAPKIITKAMVEAMPNGSVIIDTAAVMGGNCELTVPGETIMHNGVTIQGPLHLASTMARDASNMYAKNVVNLLQLLIKDKQIALDWNDQILAESVLTHNGEIKHSQTQQRLEGQAA